MEAARQCGVSVVVIRRPVQEEGISLEEAKERMDAYRVKSPDASKTLDLLRNLVQNAKDSELGEKPEG